MKFLNALQIKLETATFQQIQRMARDLHVGCYMPRHEARTRENLISWIRVMTRVRASERLERLERLTCRQLRLLVKGTKGCTAAIRAGKAAMVAFAAENGLNPNVVIYAA